MNLHAACVALGGCGLLILGDPGMGKSQLALQLIDSGGALVSDDRVVLHRDGNTLCANPPERLAGLLEVRGIGILRLPYVRDCRIHLAVQLVEREAVERMPDPAFFDCLEISVPLLSLHGYDAATAAAIRMVMQGGMLT